MIQWSITLNWYWTQQSHCLGDTSNPWFTGNLQGTLSHTRGPRTWGKVSSTVCSPNVINKNLARRVVCIEPKPVLLAAASYHCSLEQSAKISCMSSDPQLSTCSWFSWQCVMANAPQDGAANHLKSNCRCTSQSFLLKDPLYKRGGCDWIQVGPNWDVESPAGLQLVCPCFRAHKWDLGRRFLLWILWVVFWFGKWTMYSTQWSSCRCFALVMAHAAGQWVARAVPQWDCARSPRSTRRCVEPGSRRDVRLFRTGRPHPQPTYLSCLAMKELFLKIFGKGTTKMNDLHFYDRQAGEVFSGTLRREVLDQFLFEVH